MSPMLQKCPFRSMMHHPNPNPMYLVPSNLEVSRWSFRTVIRVTIHTYSDSDSYGLFSAMAVLIP
jgi:hypothetical protein